MQVKLTSATCLTWTALTVGLIGAEEFDGRWRNEDASVSTPVISRAYMRLRWSLSGRELRRVFWSGG